MYTKPTLADLKQSLADRHDGGDLPTDSQTLTLWTRLFNRGAEYCINKLRITTSTSLTTSSGTIALPDDFSIINSVVNASGEPLEQISKEDSALATTANLVYWISGNFVDGYYLNTTNDETYTVYYTFKPSPMSSDTDVCPFPDIEAVSSYAYGMLRQSESDPFEDAADALRECDVRLNEIKSQMTLNEQPLGISLQNGSY